MEHFKTLLYNYKVLSDGSKLSKTKFEITVVFLFPVGSLLAGKADYKVNVYFGLPVAA